MLLGTSGAAVHADDAAQKFAVHGIGATSCRQLIESVKKDKALGPVLASWILGYLTAVNHMTQGTFDASPVIDPQSLADIVFNECVRVPDQPVHAVVAGWINAVVKASVHTASPIIEAKAAGKTMPVRAATLESLQRALAALGRYDGKPDGTFGPKLEAALRAYQHTEKMPETGLPDAATIYRLLVMPQAAPTPKK